MSIEVETIQEPIERPKREWLSPPDMYAVPGQEWMQSDRIRQRYAERSEALEKRVEVARSQTQMMNYDWITTEQDFYLARVFENHYRDTGLVSATSLVKKGITFEHPAVLAQCAQVVFCTNWEDRLEFQRFFKDKIDRGLAGDTPIFHLPFYVKMLYAIPDEERDVYMQKIFSTGNVDAILNGLDMMRSYMHRIPQNVVTQLMSSSLATRDIRVIGQSIESVLSYVTPDDKKEIRRFLLPYLREIIPQANRAELSFCEQASYALFSTERRAIASLIEQRHKMISESGEELESSLYGGNDKSFFRHSLAKTGSRLYLLGAKQYSRDKDGYDFRGKAIVRQVALESFLAWKRAYDNADFWRRKWTYVPIEPILSFRVRKDGFVDVISVVLDGSWGILRESEKLSHKEYLGSKINKLRFDLGTLGIIHGHAHFGNFCLRFFRNGDGSIDLSQDPRVYCIDFDRARIEAL